MLKYAVILQPDDLTVTPSGVTGPDIQLSPLAKTVYPFAIECKNQQSLNIHASYKQAESHAEGTNLIPILFFSRNHDTPKVCLDADTFFRLLMTGC